MVHLRAFLSTLALILLTATLVGCPTGPSLQVSPMVLAFDEQHLQSSLTLSNIGTGSLDWTVQGRPTWLHLSSTTGTLASQSHVVQALADLTGLAPGTYSGEVAISGSNGDLRRVAVNATVAAPPTLSVQPSSLDFGSADTQRTFTISNTGAGTLAWNLSASLPAAFTVAPLQGTTASGASTTVTVTLNRASLAPGSYQGPISVVTNGGTTQVAVQAVVQALVVSPTALDFGSQLQQLTLTVRNSGNTPIVWTLPVGSLAPWLSLQPALPGGTLAAGAQSTVLVNVDRPQLTPGPSSTQLQVNSDSGQQAISVRVDGPNPVLAVTPSTLDYGIADTTHTLSIRNAGTGTLDWVIEEGHLVQGAFVVQDQPWLSVAGAATGQTAAGDTTVVTVNVDRNTVVPNASTPYTAVVRVRAVVGGDVQVPVQMRALPPTLRVLPANLAFGTSTTVRRLAVWNGGLGAITWSVDTTGFPAWLSVVPTSGGPTSGSQTDAISVMVNRAGITPADVDYSWTFQVTAHDAASNVLTPVSVTATMNVARVPAIAIDSGTATDGTPNIDDNGVPFVPFGTHLTTGTFRVMNIGTGALTWSLTTTGLPTWVKTIDPAQGTLAAGGTTAVTVTIDRTGLGYGGYQTALSITSNDPQRQQIQVMLEAAVPKVVAIGARPPELSLGLYGVSASAEVANTGDAGSVLTYEVTSNKPWLFVNPPTGSSIGTSTTEKDWRPVDISVDRSQLNSTGATGTLTVTAFETDQNGHRVPLSDVTPATIKVSVEAAPLTFEGAVPRTRIPSLVRFVLMMRDIAYDVLPLPTARLDEFVPGFTMFETDVPLELSETNQFLTTGDNLRTNLAILLDYSGSMYEAARSVTDQTISGAADPLQALYERCIEPLIDELPANYRVAIMEFHERGLSSRVVTAPDGGAAFTTDRTVLRNRLRGIHIVDHGATEFLPSIISAGNNLVIEDTGQLLFSFDDADVRALVCVSDGRMTTPPGQVKDAMDVLAAMRVRFFPVGWGKDVLHEPLARISAGTGGHYYACPTVPTGAVDSLGNPVRVPTVEALAGWCTTADPAVAPCDQSIAKDLGSQVVFSYVTLSEQSPTNVHCSATFDNPNDDNSPCLAEQGAITGGFTQNNLDFLSIAGDVKMGQLSMRTDGLKVGQTRVVLRAEYMPRNVGALTLRLTAGRAFTISRPPVSSGIATDWILNPAGTAPTTDTTFTLTPPVLGDVLRYGDFGDLLYLDFDTPAGAAAFNVTLTVVAPDNWNDIQGRYFCHPDTLRVDAQGAFAPAFPTPHIVVPLPASATPRVDFGVAVSAAQIDLSNIGGSYAPTGVWLHWDMTKQPSWVTVTPDEGRLVLNTETNSVAVTLDRSIASLPEDYTGTITFKFDNNTLGTAPITIDVPVTARVLPPTLAVTSPDFAPGTSTIDFGAAGTQSTISVNNTGQSTLHWTLDTADFASWYDITPRGGTVALNNAGAASITVNRAGLAPGIYSDSFTVHSDGGIQIVTLTIQVP